jgi:hypothetical protein
MPARSPPAPQLLPSLDRAAVCGWRRLVSCAGAASADPPVTAPLRLHSGETTIAIPFDQDRAAQLDKAFNGLMATFAEKAQATRPRRWDSLELVLFGDDGTQLDVFCNPNSASSVVDAKVLVTLAAASGVQVTTEARLTALRNDLDAFLAEQR